MPLALPPMIRDETHETLVISKEVLAAEDLAQHYVVIGKARCGGEFGLVPPGSTNGANRISRVDVDARMKALLVSVGIWDRPWRRRPSPPPPSDGTSAHARTRRGFFARAASGTRRAGVHEACEQH